MTEDRTEAGTPIVELDEDEYRAFLAREVERGTGLSVEEFVRRYEAGDLDEGEPDVSDLAGLLWLGQNGHRGAASNGPRPTADARAARATSAVFNPTGSRP
jgi:hypothetical protein